MSRPWAIERSYLDVMTSRVAAWIDGVAVDTDFLHALRRERDERAAEHAAVVAAARAAASAGGGRSVAVIPVLGPIVHRADMMTEMCGGTSVQRLRAGLRQALADPEIGGIVFDVDSPGGYADGIGELADEIRAARGRKPMAAVGNAMMASAAYWLGSQADEVLVTPGWAAIGSIGAYMAHVDQSEADVAEGVRTTYVFAGANKVEGNPHEPLSADARAYLQEQVDATYNLFVRAVARGRGVSVATVRSVGWGEGRTLTGERAVSVGMADRLGTLDDAIGRVAGGKVSPRVDIDAGAHQAAHGIGDADRLALAMARRERNRRT